MFYIDHSVFKMMFKSRFAYFGFGYGFGGCSVVALLIFWFAAPLSKFHFAIWRSSKMEDPALIDLIRKNYLMPPFTKAAPAANYNFQNCVNNNVTALSFVGHTPSCEQVQKVEDILRSLTPGFFVEVGASDGCRRSNTLWLEKKLQWSGLLMEADRNGWENLLSARRKAWHVNTCLSVQTRPLNTTFYLKPKNTGGLKKSETYEAETPFTMQCLPLYSILLALNRTTVDFFSLAVLGNELDVLNTIPFNKITFKVLTIEHHPNGQEVIRHFMESKGYIFYGSVNKVVSNVSSACAGDSIFVHPSLNLTSEQRSRIDKGQDDLKPISHAPL